MSIDRAIYLDYMATTPVDKGVIQAMAACLGKSGHFGNPSSQSHLYGWKAQKLVELARQQVADLIGAQKQEVIYTSGATEAINLALQGIVYQYQRKGKHIVTCKTEHKAVLDTCQFLQRQGFEVTYLSPESNGLIDLNRLESALRKDTLIVSIMHVNNEIGVIQDISEIGKLTQPRGILLHVDAAQSAGKVPIDVKSMQADLLSLSAHKMYGPKGIGALFIRSTPPIRLCPLVYGGNQENGLRPGTLPTHQIVGMGEASYIALSSLQEETRRIRQLRDSLWEGIKSLEGIYLNGDMAQRVPHNLNISVDGVDGEALLIALKDLAVSSGSACNSATISPSHVLRAIGRSAALAHSAIRFSVGRYTTQAEIDYTIDYFRDKLKDLRSLSPLWGT